MIFQKVALKTREVLGKEGTRSRFSYITLEPNNFLAPQFPKWNTGTLCITIYILYSKFIAIDMHINTCTKEADVISWVGKLQLPIANSTSPIQHIYCWVLSILYSWYIHVHTQNFHMITTVIQLSAGDPYKLDLWIDFPQEKTVCLANLK